MKERLTDKKGPLSQIVWGSLNRLVLALRFKTMKIEGQSRIPRTGPFLLVCNHTSRWDGLVVQSIVGRAANFMVSPNELKGLQGSVLRSMGSFPASPRYDLIGYCLEQIRRGEGIIIFPEGDVHRDPSLHPFKNGAARIALTAAMQGILLPVLPMAIHYGQHPGFLSLTVGQPIELNPYIREFANQSNIGIKSLTERMHREVCLLKQDLSALVDGTIYAGKIKKWIPRDRLEVEEKERALIEAS